MKTTIIRKVHFSFVIATICVAVVPMTVQAADRHWKSDKVGGSEDSPYDIWATENWDGAVGSGNQLHFTVSEKTYIKSTSNTQVGNDFDVDSGDFVFIGPLYFLCFKTTIADATVNIVKKGDWTINNYQFFAGNANGVHLTFTNESGNLTMTGSRPSFFLAYSPNSHVDFYHRSGTITAGQYGVCLGSNSGAARYAYLEISGGTVKNTAGHLCIGDGDNPGTSAVYVTGNGEYLAQSGYVYVGSRGASTLTIDRNGLVMASANGVMFCATTACVAGRDCFLNLNGGTLSTKAVSYGSGAAAATFTFNGGTLKALQTGTLVAAHNNLSVKVTANGGTVDSAGYDVSMAEDLDNAAGETGTMKFTGTDGTVRLTGAVNYTGMTYLNARTHLVVANATTKNAILSRGLTILRPTGASADGTHVLLSCADGTACTDADLASITLDAGLYGAKLSVVDGAIVITATTSTLTWAGASGVSVTWDGANWSGGASWTDGNDAVFATDGAIADVAATASANSVTFLENATVTGSAALAVPVIAVSNGVTATIFAPFGGAVEKTGLGTLALTQAPATPLTLISGTLTMNGGAFEDYPATTPDTDVTLANGTYGVEGGDFVLSCGTLRFATDATLTNQASVTLGTSATDAATLVKDGGDWAVSGNIYLCKTTTGSAATFIHKGGTLTAGNYLSIGDIAGGDYGTLEISGGTVLSTRSGYYAIVGANNDGLLTVKEEGSFAATGSLLVGHSGRGTVVIDDGGTVTLGSDLIFAYNTTAGDSLVNLKTGGTLLVKRIWYRNGTSSLCTFRFDGGTVKCDYQELITAHDRLFVKVSANGGTINVNGKTVACNEPILEDLESTGGGMTFMGGGKITLVAGNTYTGVTTVEVGTTVCLPSPSDIIGGFAVAVPADATIPDGVYPLVTTTGDGAFPASVLTGMVAPMGSRLILSSNGKSILCVYGNPGPTWIGGASGSLSVGANWLDGEVPTGGNCFIGNPTAANLTVGSTFAATSITFPADTALVTISGENAISGIVAISNLAPFHHVFNCPVVCANGITPDITRDATSYMTFAGGITMYDAPKTGNSVTDYWSGNITVTTDAIQEYKVSGNKNWANFVPGTVYTAKEANLDHAFVDVGATAIVERLVYEGCPRSAKSGSKTGWFSLVFDNGQGVLRTKEVRSTSDAVLFHSYAGADLVGGTIIAEKLTCATTKQTGGNFPYPVFMLNCGGVAGGGVDTGNFNGEGVWVIGPGGLSFPESGIHTRSHYETSLGKSLGGRPAATLYAYADWTLMANPNGRDAISLQIGNNNGGFLVIDTAHYAIGEAEYDSATSHTVTLDGKVTVGPMRITGPGKVVFANEYNTFSGLTVTNTATASVRVGCTPGVGLVTICSNATLEVAGCGTVALGGNLALADGACLGFNFTERQTVPLLDVTDRSVTFGSQSNVVVKVSAADGVRAKSGANVLTSGGKFVGVNVTLADGYPDWVKGVSVVDGEIVIEAKQDGLKLFVR